MRKYHLKVAVLKWMKSPPVVDVERGSTSIVFTVFLSAASFLGVTHLVQQASESNKSAKIAQRQEQARQTPFNAAAIAKQLISPGVEDGSTQWNTTEVTTNSNILPRIYIDPYVPSQSVINGTASINDYLKVMVGPVNSAYGEKAWDDSSFSSQKKISIYSADSNLLVPASVNDIYAKASVATAGIGPLLKLPRAESSATYRAKNCTPSGEISTAWTGYYCVEADITSANNSAINGQGSRANQERTVGFGLIQPPPAPVCHSITGPATWTRGSDITLTADATGVVTGYITTIIDSSQTAKGSNTTEKIFTSANGILTRANVTNITVSTNDTNQFPSGETVTILVELLSPTGARSGLTPIVTAPPKPNTYQCSIEIKAVTPPPTPTCAVSSAISRPPSSSTCSMSISNSGGPVSQTPKLYTVTSCADSTPTRGPGGGPVAVCAVIEDAFDGTPTLPGTSRTEVTGITWAQSGSTWTSTNIPCPTTGPQKFQAELTGPGGSSSCPAADVVQNSQLCQFPPTIVGVQDKYMGGAWVCKAHARTITDAIVLPADATDISVKILRYGVDDWNPCTSLNGTVLGCNRAEKTVCSGGGPGPRVTEYSQDISRLLRPGANTLYVESFNKHTYWSMWIGIEGSYRTGGLCAHTLTVIK